MRYLTKLTLTFGGLLAVALACAWLAFWSASSVQRDLERMHVASRVNEAYLSLSNHTYRLFKQFGDAFLIGDRDGRTDEEKLVMAIHDDVRLIRELIAEEVRLVGREEAEELDHLARIERKIDALIRELTWLQTDDNQTGGVPYDVRLARVLDQRIDAEFETLINQALADERAELAETETELRAAVIFHQRVAVGAGVVAAMTAVFGTWLLGRGLLHPLRLLLDGAKAFGRGELRHRIDRSGDADLDRVASAFNRMADKLAEREDRLHASREALEREVSERTRRLEALLGTLREAEANRRRLLADVSHELRTPLTIIKGEVDVTLRGNGTVEDHREALRRAGRAAAHSARIVDDLLFVARQESDEVRLRYDEVDLVALAEEAACLAAALSDAGVRPRVEADPRPIVVIADPDRIRQVLAILLENAVRYGGDEVVVRIGHASEGVALVVADNGPGLDEDEATRAFERFFRGSNAARRHENGTGLGLPVAKAIVEAHEGTIALASRPGTGVEVRVVLPERIDMAEAS